MLLSVMNTKRKQLVAGHAKEHGEFLAEWLNRFEGKPLENAQNSLLESLGLRPKPQGLSKRRRLRRKRDTESFLYCLFEFYLSAEKDLSEVRRSVGSRYPRRFKMGEGETWEYVLRTVRSLHPRGKEAVQGDKIRLSTLHLQLAFDAEFKRGDNNGVTFELVPANDYSRAVLALASLIGSGDACRVRRCRGCGRFFFAWQRADRQDCSSRCKTTYWQKTPQGREAKAAYMRGLRAKQKKLWEAKQQGRTLKRGRKGE